MLTNIENRLEELFEMIETMPQDKVEAAEKVRTVDCKGSVLLNGGREWVGFFLNNDYNSMICFILYRLMEKFTGNIVVSVYTQCNTGCVCQYFCFE